MKLNLISGVAFALLLGSCGVPSKNYDPLAAINQYSMKAPEGVETRWVSAENPTGEPGKGGITNKGAKGDAYTLIAPNSKHVIFDQTGAGIITKIWSANSIIWNEDMRRNVIINIYWDGEDKPAVSVPFAEFFGNSLGVYRKYETALFSNPEARSHNSFIQMPYRKAAKIEIVNETPTMIMFYYKINFLKVDALPEDALYFHAYWNRNLRTDLGVDYEILPKVEGEGRFIGSHIGFIGDTVYRDSWFGEGEVKIYLDEDDKYPTLCGTGTEDYIGTAWGQGEFTTLHQGAPITDNKNCLYTFYRYHLQDPVYFDSGCKVTLQTMGNAVRWKLREMHAKGAEFEVLWSYVEADGLDASKRYLDMENPPHFMDDDFPDNVSTTYYRRDDVSSVAYFYLDRPSSNLPTLHSREIRDAKMSERVYKFIK